MDSVPPVVTRASPAPISWARARVTSASSSRGGRGLVPGVHGGVEGGGGEVGGGGDGEGWAVQVGGAQGVGGVGHALGESPYEDVQGVFGSLLGQYVADRVPYAPGHALRSGPAGSGPPRASPPSRSASRTVSSSGRSAPGPSGPEARGGVLMVSSGGRAGDAGLYGWASLP